MAHEITNTDHMVSAVETPWHKLGTVTDHLLTLEEALTEAHLDWQVERQPIYVEHNGQYVRVEGRDALVRQDTGLPMGVVGGTYKPFQNVEGFDLLGVLLEGGEVEVETAGSLRGGRYVWCLAKLHKDLRVNGDEHVPYIMFLNGHTGNMAGQVLVTPVRVVCANTLRMALSGVVSSWKFRHTTNVQARVQEARETLGLAWDYYDAFQEEANALLDQAVTDAQFEAIVADVFPTKDGDGVRKVNEANANRSAVTELYVNDERVRDFHGTAWGTLQAFSTWDLWGRNVRPRNGSSEDEQQAMRIVTGRSGDFLHHVQHTSMRKVLVLGKDNALAAV